MHETDVLESEVLDLNRFKERDRFFRRAKFVDREHDGFRGTLAVGEAGESWWDGVLHQERHRGQGDRRKKVGKSAGTLL